MTATTHRKNERARSIGVSYPCRPLNHTRPIRRNDDDDDDDDNNPDDKYDRTRRRRRRRDSTTTIADVGGWWWWCTDDGSRVSTVSGNQFGGRSARGGTTNASIGPVHTNLRGKSVVTDTAHGQSSSQFRHNQSSFHHHHQPYHHRYQ